MTWSPWSPTTIGLFICCSLRTVYTVVQELLLGGFQALSGEREVVSIDVMGAITLIQQGYIYQPAAFPETLYAFSLTERENVGF